LFPLPHADVVTWGGITYVQGQEDQGETIMSAAARGVEEFAVPEALGAFAGEILDMDSHEQTPINKWVDQFGPVTKRLQEAASQTTWEFGRETRDADDAEITAESVWKVKRASAPSSFDFNRRPDVLAFTGVRRQMIFPGSVGLLSVMLHGSADGPMKAKVLPTIDVDRGQYARNLIDAYNDWSLQVAAQSDMLAPVAILLANTPEELLEITRSLVKRGCKGVWLPSSTPPGGLSPAAKALDPLWALLAEANVPITSHVGGDFGFLRTEVWKSAEAFQGFKMGDEFSLDPYTLVTTSWPTENFLASMVLGGVFERHPTLRYAIAEVGADWIGPLMAKMDLWIENSGVFNERNTGWAMRRKPSEYVKSNVRVAPFHFEDVGTYIRKYEEYGIADVLCYGSDFPHREGGKDPMGSFSRSILNAGYGEDILRKFFVENAKLVLVD